VLPDKMVFTDFLSDKTGFNIISGFEDGKRLVKSIPLQLGVDTDAFDVNNARAVAITPDGGYASERRVRRATPSGRGGQRPSDKLTARTGHCRISSASPAASAPGLRRRRRASRSR